MSRRAKTLRIGHGRHAEQPAEDRPEEIAADRLDISDEIVVVTKQRTATDDQKSAGANKSKLGDEASPRRATDRHEAESARDGLRVATYGQDLGIGQAGMHVVGNAQEQRLVSEITLAIDAEHPDHATTARTTRNVASCEWALVSAVVHAKAGF